MCAFLLFVSSAGTHVNQKHVEALQGAKGLHETWACIYLQLVDHLIKQFSSFGAIRVLKVVLYTDLDHDGLEVATNTYMGEWRIYAASVMWKIERGFFRKQFRLYGTAEVSVHTHC